MAGMTRFGVSVEEELISAFDRLIARRGYANRSEAIRDLMRKTLVEKAWDANAETVATVTLVYDHHDPGLEAVLTEIQHESHKSVVASEHTHLNRHDCLEVVILKGRAKVIRDLADRLIAAKGVKHGEVVTTAAGKALE